MWLIFTLLFKERSLFTLISIISQLQKQRKFLRHDVFPALNEAMQRNDGSLEEKDLVKITRYYGLAVPAILGEAFAKLHQVPFNMNNRQCFTSLGAMTGLFDDFFDQAMLSNPAIASLMENTEQPQRSNEQLFQYFFKKAIASSPKPDDLINKLKLVYDAQVSSKWQTDETLSLQRIEEITFQKGGYSLLFYRSGIAPQITQPEHEILFRLGALMQWSNDIFDIYKDRESKIRTLITTAANMEAMEMKFSNAIHEAYQYRHFNGFDSKAVKKFLAILSLAIFSRARAALHQWKLLSEETKGVFKLQSYTRKQLICDMEKKENLLMALQYHVQLMRTLQ